MIDTQPFSAPPEEKREEKEPPPLDESCQEEPAKASHLTSDLITFATGENDLGRLEEIEIIFNTVTEIGHAGLEYCHALRSLSLIDCNLKRISHLQPVSATLVSLCLVDQRITKMEGLCLPQLRELFLQQNRIRKLEGLEGCPHLQRLWLFSNNIPKIEGLYGCGSLRELWLQENHIAKVEGLESLVQLQNLNLAGNPIKSRQCIASLSRLPCLVNLAFDDVHFGACPVSKMEGYRTFAICSLKGIKRLDGTDVVDKDRANAEEVCMKQVVAFHDKVEAIQRAREQEIAAVELRRTNGVSYASELKEEMMAAFDQLEALVHEGRDVIAKEHARQKDLLMANKLKLEGKLDELRASYTQEIERRIAVEQVRMEREERVFKLLERQSQAIASHGAIIHQLQFENPPGASGQECNCGRARRSGTVCQRCSGAERSERPVACQELSEHTPEFQLEASRLRSRQEGTSGRGRLALLRAYRLHSRAGAQAFSNLPVAGSKEGSSQQQNYWCFYWYGEPQDTVAFCRRGLAAAPTAATLGSVALFRNPRLAVLMGAGKGKPRSINAEDEAFGVGYTIVSCKAHLTDSMTQQHQEQVMPTDPAQLEELLRAAGQNQAIVCGSSLPSGPSDPALPQPQMIIVPSNLFAYLIPECHLLCAAGPLAQDSKSLEQALEELTAPQQPRDSAGGDLLQLLEEQIQTEVTRYLEVAYEEVDSDTAAAVKAADAELRAQRQVVAGIRERIEDERGGQERLLQACRAQQVQRER
ncbi:unnamed protein product [Chrysoparadoxa australica]